MEPILIVAGAGTGKTTTLTSRIIYLISQGAAPSTICAITFTNKAAQDMREKVMKHIPKRYSNGAPGKGPFIGTFHSLGANILRKESRYVGRDKNFVIFDDDDSFRLLKQVMEEMRSGRKKATPAEILSRISKIKSDPRYLKEASRGDNAFDQFTWEVFNKYEMALLRNNAFDFDDLIEKPVGIFVAHQEVKKKYQNAYPHILIDEYQDINAMQYEMIKALAQDFNLRGGSLSAVGDDYQMIYGWRGSDIKIFMNFEKDWQGASVHFLEENYRSTPEILSAASSLMMHSVNQRTKKLWTKNPSGAAVRVLELRDEKEEAEWIVSEIKNSRLEIINSITAVLYRTNAQSRALEEALILYDIPYRIFGGLRFYERREIKDVLAALRLAVNPKDEISRERLRKSLTKSTFFACEQMLLNASSHSQPRDIIRLFLDESSYLERLAKTTSNASERQENVLSLLEYAGDFANIESFLEHVALVSAHDEPTAVSNGMEPGFSPVVLSTIHLAKGLEFDHVFVAGVTEGLLPHARSLSSQSELEEERRLLHVAMTRARKKLALTFYEIPSRFLFEIPQENILFQSLVGGGSELQDNEERYITLE